LLGMIYPLFWMYGISGRRHRPSPE